MSEMTTTEMRQVQGGTGGSVNVSEIVVTKDLDSTAAGAVYKLHTIGHTTAAPG